jgi:hypothetical protein
MDILETLADVFERQNALMKEAQDAVKSVNAGQTANKLHGPTGLFSTPGLERDVISSVMRPQSFASALPVLPTVTEDPRFPSLTGFATDMTGTQPALPCNDAPVAQMKGCNLTARFGQLRFDTNTIDIAETFMQVNRGEMRDLVLRGRLLGMTNLQPSSIDEAGVINILTKSEMVIAGTLAERELSKQIWQGSVALKQFPGLDAQIATGIKDADTEVACPALDSDIKDFAYDLIGGSGRDIVEYLSSMMFYLETNAQSMGLDPVSFMIVMRPELWFELSSVWPIKYNTNKNVAVPTNNMVMIDGRQNIVDRDQMRNSMYLDINGKRYPVMVDTGIFEHNNVNNANCLPGQYASSIYVLPLTIQGNFPVLYREYMDFRAADSNSTLLKGMQTFWTDNGIYSWAIEENKWCYKLALRTKQRIVLRAPHLAGKLQRVKYVPLQHVRSAYPGDPYNFSGGVSMRSFTPGKSVWG